MLFKGKALIVGRNALKGETSYLGERLGVGDVAVGFVLGKCLCRATARACVNVTKLGKNIDRQFARVVKGVDLRSTAGNCAWVRTPQLTFKHLELQPAIVRVCGLGYAASRPNCRWCVYRQALA